MANRFRYVGESTALLRERDPYRGFAFEFELEPGQEFDAPDGWVPEPNPHPLYVALTAPRPPVTESTAPPSPQESEEA